MRCVKRFLTAFIGTIILFVVVCPITPTPIAVLDGKTAHVHVPFAPVALLAVSVAVTVERGIPAATPDGAPALPAGCLLDLNCTRLC